MELPSLFVYTWVWDRRPGGIASRCLRSCWYLRWVLRLLYEFDCLVQMQHLKPLPQDEHRSKICGRPGLRLLGSLLSSSYSPTLGLVALTLSWAWVGRLKCWTSRAAAGACGRGTPRAASGRHTAWVSQVAGALFPSRATWLPSNAPILYPPRYSCVSCTAESWHRACLQGWSHWCWGASWFSSHHRCAHWRHSRKSNYADRHWHYATSYRHLRNWSCWLVLACSGKPFLDPTKSRQALFHLSMGEVTVEYSRSYELSPTWSSVYCLRCS